MNSPVDPALVQQELKSLHDVLDNMSVGLVEGKTKVQHELGSISATEEKVMQRVERLETEWKNLEYSAELHVVQSEISDFQGTCPCRKLALVINLFNIIPSLDNFLLSIRSYSMSYLICELQ